MWIKSLKMKGKTRKHLEYNIGEYFHDLEVMKHVHCEDKD